MATSYPGSVQTFPQMIDLTASDGALAQQYLAGMQAGNLTLTKQSVARMLNKQKIIITSDYLNTVNDTVIAVEKYFQTRYSPAYVVSGTQPSAQENGDFWFQVTS